MFGRLHTGCVYRRMGNSSSCRCMADMIAVEARGVGDWKRGRALVIVAWRERIWPACGTRLEYLSRHDCYSDAIVCVVKYEE